MPRRLLRAQAVQHRLARELRRVEAGVEVRRQLTRQGMLGQAEPLQAYQ